MPREAQIPLFLWVATAVVVHLLWGGGADRVATVIEEGVEMREFAASVRRFVRGDGRPVEVSLLEENEDPAEDDPEANAHDREDEAESDEQSAERDEAPPDPNAKPRVDDEQPEPEPKKPEPKKEPEKTPEEEEKEKEKEQKQRELLELLDKKRVAVRQHVDDPDQEDNPEANFLADHANRVDKETQARITALDQNDPNPTAGAAAPAAASESDPGNAESTRVAQSEDRAGEEHEAPKEELQRSELRIAEMPGPTPAPAASGTEQRRSGQREGAAEPERPMTKLPAQSGQTPLEARAEAEEMPDTVSSPDGSWSIARERAAATEQKARPGRKRRTLPPMRSSGTTDLLGLGAQGTTPGGLNLNLSPQVATAVIGRDQLMRERHADGQRRKSQHAGKWRPVGIERWRASIENYVASIRPGNQTALNTARAPFASYLHQVHIRIHPIFAEGFLDSLDSLPASHPLNRPEITTNLEIVLDRNEGRIVRMGVTKSSGVTAFDVSALESVDKAQPFGTPPRAIVSPDGNVYFHWEFHRRREEACATYFARPFIKKAEPKSVPPDLDPEPPPTDDEGPPERHGRAPSRAPGALAAHP